MSTFGREEQDVLRRAAQSWEKRRGGRQKKKDKAHDSKHKKRLESLTKQLRTGVHDAPEFSASIPEESSTIAPMVRGGFQSPSPPRTPPRRHVPGLVRTTTPVLVPRAPKLKLGDKFKPRTRVKGEKGYPNVTTRGGRRRSDQKKRAEQKKRAMAARHAARAKPIKSGEPIEISDSDTDQGDEKAVEEEPDWWDPAPQTTSESESDFDVNAFLRRRRGHRMRNIVEPRVQAIKNPTTNMAGFRALRARQKKARLAKKRQRVNIRHNVQTHHPFVPKLQINQKGPGQFMVRATGLSGAVKNQVKTLLARVKGKLFVNGKFVNPKRAYNLIIKLLEQKQVINIQLK